jgi:hypothetical protein
MSFIEKIVFKNPGVVLVWVIPFCAMWYNKPPASLTDILFLLFFAPILGYLGSFLLLIYGGIIYAAVKWMLEAAEDSLEEKEGIHGPRATIVMGIAWILGFFIISP